MHCATPEELHAHLSAVVSDPSAVAQMVRVSFPDWSPSRRAVEPKEVALSPRVHLDAFVWDAVTEVQARKNVVEGTRRLLASLWQSHEPILRHHADCGRQVFRP